MHFLRRGFWPKFFVCIWPNRNQYILNNRSAAFSFVIVVFSLFSFCFLLSLLHLFVIPLLIFFHISVLYFSAKYSSLIWHNFLFILPCKSRHRNAFFHLSIRCSKYVSFFILLVLIIYLLVHILRIAHYLKCFLFKYFSRYIEIIIFQRLLYSSMKLLDNIIKL